MGMIPVAYAPSSVVLGTDARTITCSLLPTTRASARVIRSRPTTASPATIPTRTMAPSASSLCRIPLALSAMTNQVFQNNHWDLTQNIQSAAGGSAQTAPVALPAKIGDPSLIKHVFLIIRENRTYDQILGDVAAGNGDPSLAVFGGKDTPNAHALVQRFPLFDNFYDPSRQSADGHQWITEGMAPYADDIQSPDWIRSYPGGNAGDALAYQNKGFLFSEASAAGLSLKIYGEYVENDTFLQPNGADRRAELEPILRRLTVLRGRA